MKIIFEPNHSNTNTYVNILRDSLAKVGIVSCSVQSAFKSWSAFRAIEVVHLNWFENVGSIAEFVKKFTKLIIFRLSGKKLIWTFHNKQPHNQSYQSLSRLLMYCLAHYSRYIIIHSRSSENLLVGYYGESVRSRIQYVPHPHYIQTYGEPMNNNVSSAASPLSLLFLGAVKPYKNLELLIDAVQSFDKHDVELTIMGKPASDKYRLSLMEKADRFNNIHLNLQFVDDARISKILSEYDLMVFPYSMESSLNSGSVILAFSYGKTVICPAIGTVTDFDDHENMIIYDYDTPESHLNHLKNAIQQAILNKKQNPEIFELRGKKMLEKVKTGNNPEEIGKLLVTLYQN